jgi:hypothetical protein
MNVVFGETWSWPGFILPEEDIKVVGLITEIRKRKLLNIISLLCHKDRHVFSIMLCLDMCLRSSFLILSRMPAFSRRSEIIMRTKALRRQISGLNAIFDLREVGYGGVARIKCLRMETKCRRIAYVRFN